MYAHRLSCVGFWPCCAGSVQYRRRTDPATKSCATAHVQLSPVPPGRTSSFTGDANGWVRFIDNSSPNCLARQCLEMDHRLCRMRHNWEPFTQRSRCPPHPQNLGSFQNSSNPVNGSCDHWSTRQRQPRIFQLQGRRAHRLDAPPLLFRQWRVQSGNGSPMLRPGS
jgi:hypothetical protein